MNVVLQLLVALEEPLQTQTLQHQVILVLDFLLSGIVALLVEDFELFESGFRNLLSLVGNLVEGLQNRAELLFPLLLQLLTMLLEEFEAFQPALLLGLVLALYEPLPFDLFVRDREVFVFSLEVIIVELSMVDEVHS